MGYWCSKEQRHVVYLIQTGVSLNWGYYIKGNHSPSKHAFIGIVDTTKVHLRILKMILSALSLLH